MAALPAAAQPAPGHECKKAAIMALFPGQAAAPARCGPPAAASGDAFFAQYGM